MFRAALERGLLWFRRGPWLRSMLGGGALSRSTRACKWTRVDFSCIRSLARWIPELETNTQILLLLLPSSLLLLSGVNSFSFLLLLMLFFFRIEFASIQPHAINTVVLSFLLLLFWHVKGEAINTLNINSSYSQ